MDNTIILVIGISLAIGFLLNLYLTPVLIYLSHKHGLYDEVNHRKVHTENTSRLGGIGIFVSFFISALISPALVRMISGDLTLFSNPQLSILLLALSLVVIFIIGVLDDFAQIRARYKLLGQFIASILVVAGGAQIERIQIPFSGVSLELGLLAVPVTILWLVGISNAINMIDGVDGLSSGISIIASLVYGFVFLLYGQLLPAIIIYALIGSLFGYLFFNFPPAKIFMGDSGSLFLGFILALLPIAAFTGESTSLVMPLTMLLIPILDVVAAIWRRKREKRNIFSPDRFHLHHKMMNLGLSVRNILAVIYGLCIIMGVSVIVFESSGRENYFIILCSWIIVIIFFLYLHYSKKEL
ncbi:MAG: undecaprenyl/decaprenyl-phosphate alpha-N-acetylglucosaminyl 1-phosphate transferase [Spirochaetales bacterium]|nr:undecaprenyl/decaprenyl-phosphate alpha-N-acetylglucosaminyl 1-phosphate transferase [Spirochaetales bacterium]